MSKATPEVMIEVSIIEALRSIVDGYKERGDENHEEEVEEELVEERDRDLDDCYIQ